MSVACPICDTLHELTDANVPEGLKQSACQACGANLILVSAHPASGNPPGKRTAQGSAPGKARASRTSSTPKAWGIAAIAILCLINYSLLGATVFGLHYSITTSEAYQTSESFLKHNELLQQVIGDDIQFGFLPSARMHSKANTSTAEFSITVKGSYRSTVAWVALVKQQETWQVVKASYKDASGTFQPLLGHERAFQLEQPTAQPAKPQLTQQDILVVLTAYDKAVNARNVEGILAHMADDMSFQASVHLTSDIRTFHFTRSEYQAHLQKNYLAAITYQFKRSGTSISITADGTRAKARFRMLEHSTFKSGEWRFKGTEVMHFELRDGRPLINRVELTGQTEKV